MVRTSSPFIRRLCTGVPSVIQSPVVGRKSRLTRTSSIGAGPSGDGSPGQHGVLLEHVPAVVARPLEGADDRGDVDIALTERPVQPRAHRLGIAELTGPHPGRQRIVDVLEVHVLDARRVLDRERDRVDAADQQVPGVQAQPDRAPGQHPVDSSGFSTIVPTCGWRVAAIPCAAASPAIRSSRPSRCCQPDSSSAGRPSYPRRRSRRRAPSSWHRSRRTRRARARRPAPGRTPGRAAAPAGIRRPGAGRGPPAPRPARPDRPAGTRPARTRSRSPRPHASAPARSGVVLAAPAGHLADAPGDRRGGDPAVEIL